MKDYTGTDVKVGDLIIYASSARGFHQSHVKKITCKFKFKPKKKATFLLLEDGEQINDDEDDDFAEHNRWNCLEFMIVSDDLMDRLVMKKLRS